MYKPQVLFLFFLLPLSGFAQSNLIFHRITTQDGLAHDAITYILRDNKGFLWIGTTNGLSRYDGVNFLNFFHSESDSNSISDNDIASIAEDKQGTLYISTYFGGIDKFNFLSRTFKRTKPYYTNGSRFMEQAVALSTFIDSNYLPLAFTDIGLLDTRYNKVKRIQVPKITWPKSSSIVISKFDCLKIYIDRKKRWWLVGDAGFMRYDPGTNKFDIINLEAHIPSQFNLHGTWDCKEDLNGHLWIVGGAGLFEYDPATRKLTQHYPTRFNKADVKSNFAKAVLCDEDGSVWFGTDNGLFHYFPAANKYYVYHHHPYNNSSISNNDINCIYKDKQNILWIGTENGLNAVYPVTSSFDFYSNIPGDKNSLKSNITGAAFKDINGNTWIGTQYGLEVRDKQTEKFTSYTYHDKRLKEQSDYYVMPVLQNDTSTFWVGTWGAGLQLFNYRTRKFEASYVYTEKDTLSVCSNFITSLCKDEKGNLWIATWNGGIDKFDIKQKKFEHYNARSNKEKIPFNYIGTIRYVDNTIWASCSKGLLKFDSSSNKFSLIRLTNDTANIVKSAVNRIAAGPDNSLWIGTLSGLLQYYPEKNQFEKINSIPNYSIVGILEDEKKNLWLATSNGIIQYNSKTTESVTYTLKDGLPVTSFPGHCAFSQAADGEIFVNSTNGLIHFYPDKIQRNLQTPPLYFTSIKIKNTALKAVDSILKLNTLKLSYNQNYITIDFAALNFINPASNMYAYQLTGIDKDWVYSNNRNEAVYTNLSPGDYVFKVKASNDAGLWNNKAISLNIHINAPWWRTWWFYTLCALITIAVLYLFYNVRIKRLREMYTMRSTIARDLHDEIGSTLTSINILSKISARHIETDTKKVKTMIGEINDQSLQIQQNMSDIVWAINPENDKVENMIVRMRELLSHTLEPKNIYVEFKTDEANTKALLNMQQRRDFFLLFKEAVNNIAKYAQCKKAYIQLVRQNGNIELTVADDGVGFDPEKITSSNGLKNMKARAEALNGKINIESKPKHGTVIKLSIPAT